MSLPNDRYDPRYYYHKGCHRPTKLFKSLWITLGLSLASLLGLMQPAAAAEYYNCSNPNGCQLISSIEPKDDSTATQYPVVMAHGLGGFNTLFGLLGYFNGIPQALMQGGNRGLCH